MFRKSQRFNNRGEKVDDETMRKKRKDSNERNDETRKRKGDKYSRF